MSNSSSYLSGEFAVWPNKSRLVEALHAAGLKVREGQHSIRVESCEHFVFQGLPDLPAIDADATSAAEMIADARRVSDALSAAQIPHRFEVYGPADELLECFQYQWVR